VASLKGSATAGEDGRALCRAYVDAFTPARSDDPIEKVVSRVEHGLHRGMTRLFLSRRVYEAQGLPPAGLWTLVPLLPFPMVFAAETLRRRSKRLDDLADTLAREERRTWLAHHTKGKSAAFRPTESLRR
jgi:hypothetical protein